MPQSIVISEEVAQQYFGRSQAVGKKLTLSHRDEFKEFVVSAVTKTSPQNSSIKIKLLLPTSIDKNKDNQWINFYLNTFVLLSPQANVKAVEKKFAQVYTSKAAGQMAEAKTNWGYNSKITYRLQPLLDMHLSTQYQATNGIKDSSDPIFSYILMGIAVFLLLIACINFVNLTVAKSLKRSREIGIRKVVGGQRSQLIGQFMGESFLLSFLAFGLALLWVELSLGYFNTLANKALSFSYLLDTPLVLAYITLFVCTGFLAGAYPALVLSGFSPVQTLYGRFNLSGKNYLQKGLVVFQFALASFLIVATGIMFEQFSYLTTMNLGYNDQNLVVLNTGYLKTQQVDLFRNELSRNPAIAGIAPKNGGMWHTIAKINEGKETTFSVALIDHAFLPLMQVPMAAGRNFSEKIPADSSRAVLVNETFAKEAGWKNPLGQKIDFFTHKHTYEVVGVVKDYHDESLATKIFPQVYFSDPEMGTPTQLLIKLKPKQTVAGLQHIEKVFKKLVPTQPFVYVFKDVKNFKNYEAELKWKQMISLAALLTIFISCMGLFGLATFTAEKRTKEIGIRKVMGASVQGLVKLLSADFLKLVFIASVIALPLAAYVMNKWLEKYPYRVSLSASIFVSTVLITSILAVVTVSYQAIRVALMNPVESLKTE